MRSRRSRRNRVKESAFDYQSAGRSIAFSEQIAVIAKRPAAATTRSKIERHAGEVAFDSGVQQAPDNDRDWRLTGPERRGGDVGCGQLAECDREGDRPGGDERRVVTEG